jgi:hypothetical protein
MEAGKFKVVTNLSEQPGKEEVDHCPIDLMFLQF